jgi:hypothetical protein
VDRGDHALTAVTGAWSRILSRLLCVLLTSFCPMRLHAFGYYLAFLCAHPFPTTFPVCRCCGASFLLELLQGRNCLPDSVSLCVELSEDSVQIHYRWLPMNVFRSPAS